MTPWCKQDLENIMALSSNPVVYALAAAMDQLGVGKKPPSITSQFKRQMSELMASLKACTPHYVRCIKPNEERTPRLVDARSGQVGIPGPLWACSGWLPLPQRADSARCGSHTGPDRTRPSQGGGGASKIGVCSASHSSNPTRHDASRVEHQIQYLGLLQNVQGVCARARGYA